MTLKNASSFFRWLRQPNSWLSLAAAVISISTFYLVYLDEGELRVNIPDRIAVAADQNDLMLVIPLTISNTGAPRSLKQVTRVTASASVYEEQREDPRPVNLSWLFEKIYVGRRQWLNKYPEYKEEIEICEQKKKEDCVNALSPSDQLEESKLRCTDQAKAECARDDYLDYVGRPVPFAIKGGESVHKVFEFLEYPNSEKGWGHIRGFELVVVLSTGTGAVSTELASYGCHFSPLQKVANYCRRTDL